MTRKLEDLYNEYDRDDQELKRHIGEYLYERPARWIPRQTLVAEFDIDDSGISRHLDHLHDNGFIQSHTDDDQREVQWDGRGAGGFEYWLRQAVPSQLWAASSELRPLLTVEALGSAYIPTLMFGMLFILGIVTALFAVVVTYLPSNSALGFTVIDLVILTGWITITASTLLVLSPIGRLLEIGLHRAWKRLKQTISSDQESE